MFKAHLFSNLLLKISLLRCPNKFTLSSALYYVLTTTASLLGRLTDELKTLWRTPYSFSHFTEEQWGRFPQPTQLVSYGAGTYTLHTGSRSVPDAK